MTSGDRRIVLAIDTATSRTVIALGDLGGRPLAEEAWAAGFRHGEELLPHLQAILAAADLALGDVATVVVGTGPGAFTGLRVGLATAKALAVGLGRPLIGVATSDALLAADARARRSDPGSRVLLLPAGPNDRVLVRDGIAVRLAAADDQGLAGVPIDDLIAVDLGGRAPEAAAERGALALAGLGAALLQLGALRLAAGDTDDTARLVPRYVTLPRGIGEERGEVEWSHGPR